jgi:hypothetical protein
MAKTPTFPTPITILRASKTTGFRLVALTVADPNVGAVPPVALTIAMATDSTFWKSDGVTWTLVSAGASGATLYPDDVFVTWGDGTPAEGGNFTQGVDATGKRYMKLLGDNFSGAADDGETVSLVVSTGEAVTTADVIGKVAHATGNLLFQTADTNALAGVTAGGDTGNLLILTGDAKSEGGGVSGDTGSLLVRSGESADAVSGDVIFKSGAAGTTSGTVEIGSGDATGTSGDVDISAGAGATYGKVEVRSGGRNTRVTARGFLPSSADLGNNQTGQAFGLTPIIFAIKTADDSGGTIDIAVDFDGYIVDLWIIKLTAPASLGSTISIETELGGVYTSIVGGALSLPLLTAGEVTRTPFLSATAADRTLTKGDNLRIVTTAPGAPGNLSCEVYVMAYRTTDT